MKMKNTFIGGTVAVTQSTWMLRVLMTLSLIVTVFSVNGCQPHH